MSASSGPAQQGRETLACVSCRARKLKCDRLLPACGRCVKVSNGCVYPESRRKPTFKRRNVKELEARLAEVEEHLKGAHSHRPVDADVDDGGGLLDNVDVHFVDFDLGSKVPTDTTTSQDPSYVPLSSSGLETQQGRNPFEHLELLDMGMSEVPPPFEVMEELNNTFFKTQHDLIPIVHPGRYLQAFYGNQMLKPPMCLQYAIWTLGAFGTHGYHQYQDVFYQRARGYADSDEMKGHGEHFITLQHAQAWALISTFEAKKLLFTRAAVSSAKCIRLVQMMGLDRLDGDTNDLPPTLAPTQTWVEVEERRRVFWGAFTIDAHSSVATGWPCLVDFADVTTRLPASEEAFISCREEETAFLDDVFQGAPYNGFSCVIVICHIFKTILRHVHRLRPADRPEDVNHGPFWMRHRDLDNKLSSVFLFLPEKLRLPQNMRNVIATQTNVNLHASVICLHHAALEMTDKHDLPVSIKETSLARLKASAEEIVNIIKLTSHTHGYFKSALCAVAFYCATTVYVYLAKQDSTAGLSSVDLSNLEIIIRAMEAVGRTHIFTHAFLQQACLDIERNGLSAQIRIPSMSKYRDLPDGQYSHLPLPDRTSVSKHTGISPVLPGRVPLKSPQRDANTGSFRGEVSGILTLVRGSDGVMRKLLSGDCFQAVLGAVTRNVSAPDRVEVPRGKRKRASPSSNASSTLKSDMARACSGGSPRVDASPVESDSVAVTTLMEGAVSWQFNNPPSHPVLGQVNIPDRTSTASSPTNGDIGTGATSRSSHTWPEVGLGNSAEENRIDLRSLQDRISTPIWPATEENLLAQATDSMVDCTVLTGGIDPWTLTNNNMNWNNEGTNDWGLAGKADS